MYAQSVEFGSENHGAMVRADDILPASVLKIGLATELIISGRPQKKTAPGIPGGEDWRM